MKLYELTDAYLRLQHIEETTGEDFHQALDDIKDDVDVKLENIGKLIRSLEVESVAFNEEGQRLLRHTNFLTKKIDWLKEYAKKNMELLEIDKVGQIVKLSLRNSPPTCEIIHHEEIPLVFRTMTLEVPAVAVNEELLEYKVADIIDKKQIINLWKDGVNVPGTNVVQKKHLRIM